MDFLSTKLNDHLLSGQRSFQERHSLNFLDKLLQGPSESYREKRDAVEGIVQKSSFDADILDMLSRKESMKGIEHILGELSEAMRSLPQDGEVVKSYYPDHSIQYLLHVHRYLSKLVYLLRNSLGLSSSQGKYIIFF